MSKRASIPRIGNARTPEEWAERIRGKWQNNVESIFAVGLELSNSREELGTAEFWKMVRDELKYAKSTVLQLIKIGTDAGLREGDASLLPPHWGTLQALTRLTDEEFEPSAQRQY